MNYHPYRFWWNLFTPNMMARASLSSWEYLFSDGARLCDAKAIGFFVPSSQDCPYPIR